jgi:hypothetical protein
MEDKKFGDTAMGENLGCAGIILAIAIPLALILIFAK